MTEQKKAWVGFDLDGTLAQYDEWKGIHHIGEPIEPIVNIAKNMIKRGDFEVKIFTARVCDGQQVTAEFIKDWTEKQGLGRLEVTNAKDMNMVACFDDRSIQVMPNQGVVLQDVFQEIDAELDAAMSELYIFKLEAGNEQ